MTQFFPSDGSYFPTGIYAQFLGADIPALCRKYHISSAPFCAASVAGLVLPILRARKALHKVVRSADLLQRQMLGAQAGKFITLYLPVEGEAKGPLIQELGEGLAELARSTGAEPSPILPRSRAYKHVFAEMPLDPAMFIYGGFVVDPTV